MLLTWEFSKKDFEPSLSMRDLGGAHEITRQPVPWPVYCSHIFVVSIRALANDAAKIADVYFEKLCTDRLLIDHFSKCMHEFYQRSGNSRISNKDRKTQLARQRVALKERRASDAAGPPSTAR